MHIKYIKLFNLQSICFLVEFEVSGMLPETFGKKTFQYFRKFPKKNICYFQMYLTVHFCLERISKQFCHYKCLDASFVCVQCSVTDVIKINFD